MAFAGKWLGMTLLGLVLRMGMWNAMDAKAAVVYLGFVHGGDDGT